jgi:type IV pilus assembly protein PilB
MATAKIAAAPLVSAEGESQARALADRLGLPFVDLASFRVDADLFRSIPVEWMLRFVFVPERRTDKALTIICADPTDVVKLDELELLAGLAAQAQSREPLGDLRHPAEERVVPARARRGDRRLPDAARLGGRRGRKRPSPIDRITQDASPIIKLVDSIVFNAIQRRASDVHIETQENVV